MDRTDADGTRRGEPLRVWVQSAAKNRYRTRTEKGNEGGRARGEGAGAEVNRRK